MPVPDSARKRHEKLSAEIEHHNRRYYDQSDPEISDAQYDKLYDELVALEKQHPALVTPDSPTQKTGGAVLERFQKAEHRIPMLSLEKAYEYAELEAWRESMERELGRALDTAFTVEPKIDGDSLELVYEGGALVLAATRGDGRVGENVTHTVRTIKGLPHKLPKAPEVLEVRGEAFIRLDDFKKINQAQLAKGEEPYANPRNLTSGTIKQLDARITESRPVCFMAHGAGRIVGRKFARHSEILDFLRAFGFPIVDDLKVVDSLEKVRGYYEKILERRDRLPYEIDGIVVKVDTLEIRDALGSRSKSPRWAIAWKFPAREENTEILGVDWNVGRSGKITPVARLKPVGISGVTVSNATLHNVAQMKKLGVKLGDWVVVTRAGDVIPYVVKVIASKRKGSEKDVPIPRKCPTCGAPVEETETDVLCTDAFSCPAQIKKAIEHFCSRGAMNIEGLGEEWVDIFVEKKLVRTAADLYALKKEKLVELERMGDKLASNFLESIEKSKKTTLPRFLNALGIRQVGDATASALADHFGSLERIMDAPAEELEGVMDVGPIVAKCIREFFDRKENRKVIDRLIAAGIAFAKPKLASDKLAGQVVVFTGGLDRLTRDDAKKTVLEHGGRTADSVSKSVTMVVAGPGAGSKLDKAKKLGITTVTEDQFFKLLGL